ncbi:MAG: hypothetical protein ACQESF_01590 [Nanobdellota archaeon]
MANKDLCMTLYMGSETETKTANITLEDKLPGALRFRNTLYTPQAWKLNSAGYNTGYSNINPSDFNKYSYNLQQDFPEIIPENSFALAKDCHDRKAPIIFYSNKSLSPEQLNKKDMSELVKKIEKKLPILKGAVAIKEKQYTKKEHYKPESTHVLMEESNLPEYIIPVNGKNVTGTYYPALRTNSTCCHEKGNFSKVNGDCSGKPGQINLDYPAEMIMIREGNSDSVIVYMKKEMEKELLTLHDPRSEIRNSIYMMHRHLSEKI